MSEVYKGGTILVPLKGGSSDEEVVRMAAAVAKKYRSTLYAISIVEVRQELALDSDLPVDVSHAEQVLTKALKLAQEYGVDIETGILQARSAGVAIVEEAVARNAALIMMAVTYRNRRGEQNMGITVPYIMKNAPCRVWLFRDALE
jgi:nucleotide-binding universal stress UspA family protein